MSIRGLQEYTRYSKYARFNKELGRRETWDEQVDRVFAMHREHLGPEIFEQMGEDVDFAEKMLRQKRVLGSQRALQFGGQPILVKNPRIYNCSASHCDRPRFFQECMHMLLCGCGVGFSVQKHHIDKLPDIRMPDNSKRKTFVIPDTIEGWADAVGVLMSSYFVNDKNLPFPEYSGCRVTFDYNLIRPEGSPLSSGNKAPGPDGLRASIGKIEYLLDKCCKLQKRLRPIDAYDIVMHASDAVLSGGVRRSATICIFSKDDEEMMSAKIGAWRRDNEQRGRSNNSVILLRDETTREEFDEIIEKVKQFGEPGFVWADDLDIMFNPCAEISMYPVLEKDGKKLSGWQVCNLCEINMKKVKTEEDFLDACKAAGILGTIQATYTKFDYLGKVSEEITKRDALLGVSMTGMSDNPDMAFSQSLQRKGAKVILEVNEILSDTLGINPSARSTCVKPSGTSSCILGTSSGIHPHHAKRYFRRVQANKMEVPMQYFRIHNPLAVETSVWNANGTDVVITFLCEVPDGAKTKNQVDAITMLENVKLTQQNWVESGTRHDRLTHDTLRHNVSNTINVRDWEWHDVAKHIYRNRRWYAGISMLPVSGDKDYPQSPFTAVFTPTEIVREYGDGCMFASGLIVDGMRAFNNNLWAACDCSMGIGEIIRVKVLREKIRLDCETNGARWKEEGLSPESPDKLLQAWLEHNVENYADKVDWVRRARQFADRYFDEDLRKMTYCLKDVANWKLWCDLSREYKDVDWTECKEDESGIIYDMGAGSACSGGQCDLGELGLVINEKKHQTDMA